ncbi:MAG TPA: pyruvate kinase [Patescibacteria group bacterium]|nr:pyruvate kinase [Patescibacteria group bacterium]
MRNSNHNDKDRLKDLIRQLDFLRSEMLRLEESVPSPSASVPAEHRASAANLMHYLALRRHDIRQLQAELAALGLSSLGRTESHVISALSAVLSVLTRLAGLEEIVQPEHATAPSLGTGRKLLEKNTEMLLGPSPDGRNVRIMVTMPTEAAQDYDLVRDLVVNGMNCMRINCAHDSPEAWEGMIQNLRRAERETGKPCKVEMDIPGPKLRTGPLKPGPAVLKYRPKRNAFGRVTKPARIWLTSIERPEPAPAAADAVLPVPEKWLAGLQRGTRIQFTDARGSKRWMSVRAAAGEGRWAEARKTAYVTPRTLLGIDRKKGRKSVSLWARPGRLPFVEQPLRLRPGDTLVLTRTMKPGVPAKYDAKGNLIAPARIGVTLPEFFDGIRVGEPVWFDDGKIGGVVTEVSAEKVSVSISHARASGEKLGAEKGINVPETNLSLPPLSATDVELLKFIVAHADIVGFSFVRSEGDVQELQRRLAELGGEHLGIVLKIETRQGFENLPRLLLAAMQSRAVGVMIARGDLAVECGYQRLAEIQEEILWICEAAHMPVVWATQVLESLAKSGIPLRSEITDAAMGERAECVMLNKGPYIVEAVHSLDDILKRMVAHQDKKRSMLRKLHLATAFPAAAKAS